MTAAEPTTPRRTPAVDQPLQPGQVADAAAGLYRDVQFRESLDDRQVGLAARFRTVEVDDVQTLRTGAGIPACEFDRVPDVARDLVEVALVEPHDLAAEQVDCRYHFHAWSRLAHVRRSRKFFSRRAPNAPERSGWNCAAAKLSRSTMAVNGVP